MREQYASFKENTKKDYIISIISLISVTLYPCLFIYFNNVGEAYLKDILRISMIFLVVSLILYSIGQFICKETNKSAIITSLVMLCFMNFALIENGIIKLVPTLYYWHIVLILLFILMHIGYLIYKAKNVSILRLINVMILAAFGGLILFNAVISTPTIFQKLTFEKIEGERYINIDATTPQKNPNVYFFIFDEYGGLDCLERYCDYDNSGFLDSLKERGFNVSSKSTNGTISTTVAIPNLLNLDIINKDGMLESEKRQQLKNPALYKIMQGKEYKLNTIDYKSLIDQTSSDFKFVFDGDLSSESAEGLICEKTAWYPFVGVKGSGQILALNSAFEYCATSSKLQDSNLFTLGYFQSPHAPYIVDAEGKETNSFDMNNIKNSKFYLGQLKYINSKIINLVDSIIDEDPNSVIIIQSDHGFRRPVLLQDMYGVKMEDPELEYNYMSSTLNCVYYKGEKLDIEGMSGVNTLRTVLNQLFEMNLQMIEEETGAGNEV